jgi:hypothetical protein
MDARVLSRKLMTVPRRKTEDAKGGQSLLLEAFFFSTPRFKWKPNNQYSHTDRPEPSTSRSSELRLALGFDELVDPGDKGVNAILGDGVVYRGSDP